MALNQRSDSEAEPGPGSRRLHLRDVDGAEPGEVYAGVGADLRAARVRAGKEIGDIARTLRIGKAHLAAIEEGRFGDLPGTVYALGFLRSYAEHLGLDADAVVEGFKDETSPLAARTKLVFPLPAPAGRSPGARFVAVSLVLVAVVFGGWYALSERERTVVELVPEVPENLLQAARETPEEALSGSAEPDRPAPGSAAAEAPAGFADGIAVEAIEPAAAAIEAAPSAAAEAPAGLADGVAVETIEPAAAAIEAAPSAAPAAPAVELAEVLEGADETGPLQAFAATDDAGEAVTLVAAAVDPQVNENTAAGAPASAEADADAAPAMAIESQAAVLAPPIEDEGVTTGRSAGYVPQVYGTANTGARVVVIARADSWVQVRGPGDELLLTRVMRAGDRYLVPDRGDLMMRTGNAGALDIVVDGTTIAPIGPVGAVLRNVSLDPDRLLAESAANP